MTPQQKADHLQAKHGERFAKMMIEAEKLSQLPRNIDSRANRLYEIIEEISVMVEPMAACKNGCAHCCHQAVIISSWEAERIAKFTRKKINDIPHYDPFSNTREEMVEKYTGVPCPFLSDKACSIYEVRPTSCRLHWSLADDDTACDIINRPGDRVPYFNLAGLSMTAGFLFISANCNFGDIREFFGEC